MNIKYTILALSSALLLIGCGSGGGSTETTSPAPSETASGGTSSGSVTITDPNPYPADVILDDTKEAFLKAVNDVRSQGYDCGSEGRFDPTTALIWSDALYGAAFEHSNDMAEQQDMEHKGSGMESDWTGIAYGKQSSSQERMENNGYQNWTHIGENVAYGQKDLSTVMDAWMKSDGHCKNIMNPNFSEIGMAFVEDTGTASQKYWTQNFGSR